MRGRIDQNCSRGAAPVRVIVMRARFCIMRALRETQNYTFRCPKLDEHGELWYRVPVPVGTPNPLRRPKLPKIAKKRQNGQNCQKLSKIVKNCQKLSKMVKNCQKLSKIAKNRQKSSKIVKNCQKLSKIVKNCQKLSKIA